MKRKFYNLKEKKMKMNCQPNKNQKKLKCNYIKLNKRILFFMKKIKNSNKNCKSFKEIGRAHV